MAAKKKSGTRNAQEDTEAVAEEESTSEASAERKRRANAVVSKYVGWSAGMGAIPFPLWDIAAVGTMQSMLIRDLLAIYEKPFSRTKVRSIVSVLLGSLSPALLWSATASSMLKFIPGVGHVVAAVSLPMLAGAASYAVGKVMISHLENGGSITDFDASKVKDKFSHAFEEGKQKFKDMTSGKATEAAPEGS